MERGRGIRSQPQSACIRCGREQGSKRGMRTKPWSTCGRHGERLKGKGKETKRDEDLGNSEFEGAGNEVDESRENRDEGGVADDLAQAQRRRGQRWRRRG